MLALFQFIRLLGSGHQAIVLENLALRQQLAIYKRKQRRPRLLWRDRWFWIALATHLALQKDAPEPRKIRSQGKIVAIPQVGGLHHRYERRAA
jgi:hypothetical protein